MFVRLSWLFIEAKEYITGKYCDLIVHIFGVTRIKIIVKIIA